MKIRTVVKLIEDANSYPWDCCKAVCQITGTTASGKTKEEAIDKLKEKLIKYINPARWIDNLINKDPGTSILEVEINK